MVEIGPPRPSPDAVRTMVSVELPGWKFDHDTTRHEFIARIGWVEVRAADGERLIERAKMMIAMGVVHVVFDSGNRSSTQRGSPNPESWNHGDEGANGSSGVRTPGDNGANPRRSVGRVDVVSGSVDSSPKDGGTPKGTKSRNRGRLDVNPLGGGSLNPHSIDIGDPCPECDTLMVRRGGTCQRCPMCNYEGSCG